MLHVDNLHITIVHIDVVNVLVQIDVDVFGLLVKIYVNACSKFSQCVRHQCIILSWKIE